MVGRGACMRECMHACINTCAKEAHILLGHTEPYLDNVQTQGALSGSGLWFEEITLILDANCKRFISAHIID